MKQTSPQTTSAPDSEELQSQPGPSTASQVDSPAPLAHDARNWLAVLRVYCDLLKNSRAIAPGYEVWLTELSNAVDRGSAWMESLLTGTRRTDTHVVPFNVVPFPEQHPLKSGPASANGLDLAVALSMRMPLLRGIAGERVRIEMALPSHSVAVMLSESDFDRILYNLAVNAIEAMPENGTLHISLAIDEAQDAVVLGVTDSGHGIEPELLPHVFGSGVSGKKTCAGHPRRRGMGLAIVRELAGRAHGTVRVRSTLGRGSCFEVVLPRARV